MEKKWRSAICYRYTTFIHKFKYISCNDIFESACEKDVLLLISVLKTVINLRIIRVENQFIETQNIFLLSKVVEYLTSNTNHILLLAVTC